MLGRQGRSPLEPRSGIESPSDFTRTGGLQSDPRSWPSGLGHKLFGAAAAIRVRGIPTKVAASVAGHSEDQRRHEAREPVG
jgi:hypothetical protein